MECPKCNRELIDSKIGPVCLNPDCEVFDDYKLIDKKTKKDQKKKPNTSLDFS